MKRGIGFKKLHHPVFFTPEEIKRMSKTEGSYQYKGDNDGKKTDTD